MTTKRIPCPDCGRKMVPSNLGRHRLAKHIPQKSRTKYGTRLSIPALPIKLGKKKDRRYDDLVPRGEGDNRYRIYRLRSGDLQLLATTDSPQAMGLALTTLHDEGEWEGDDSVGVLDTATEPGHWIVSPWTLGRRA